MNKIWLIVGVQLVILSGMIAGEFLKMPFLGYIFLLVGIMVILANIIEMAFRDRS